MTIRDLDILSAKAVVIGSGCAGLNAADWLVSLGEKDVLLITDGMKRGTSRNAGSDKQTYYKLSLAGGAPDSVLDMANDLIGEGVNGDTALAEAAGSAQAFLRLVQLGVPFPTNEYGEFIGYQTDHDERGRATSAGPLTSKLMTEALEREVVAKGVRVLEPVVAFHILKQNGRAAGVLAFDIAANRLKLVLAANIIAATGGPAVQLYRDHGIDLETELLEVRVCAQHHNGGAAVDSHWQTTLPGLYCAGEAAGSFGAYRPGGSALNATQVGSMRAAQHIVFETQRSIPELSDDLLAQAEEALDAVSLAGNPALLGCEMRREMSCAGAHMRDLSALDSLDKRLAALLGSRGSCTD